MPSHGGARMNAGRIPDPRSLRQDPADWTHLPAEGRLGEPPPWPLPAATRRELVIWKREWARPQAVMWERLGMVAEVALYVRAFARVEQPDSPAALQAVLLRQQHDLGLTIAGAARNHWIVGTAPTPEPKVKRSDDPARASAKARFRAIEGGAPS